MLRLDGISLVWAFFRPGEKEDCMEVRKEDQRDPDEKVVEIEIERLRDFKNHPVPTLLQWAGLPASGSETRSGCPVFQLIWP